MSQPPLGPALHGAVDLSALRNRPAPGAPPAAGAGAAGTHAANAFVVDVTEATFEADVLVQSQTVPVVIDFWAQWCGPCRMIAPILENLAQRYAGRLKIVKLEVDTAPALAARHGAQSIPLLVVFDDGKEVERVIGAHPEPHLDAVVQRALRMH